VIRLPPALVLGVTIGAAAVSAVTADPVSSVVWPIGIAVAALCAALLLFARSLRGIAARPPGDVGAAEREGRLALARIDAIRQTGTTINDHPLCELDLTVGGPGVDGYRITTRALVPIILAPRRQPGALLAVQRASQDAAAVVILDEPPQPWFDRTAEVTRFAERPPLRVAEASRPLLHGPLVAIGAVALLLVGAGGAVAARWPVVEPAVTSWRAGGALAVDFRSGSGLADAIDALVDEVGDPRFTHLVVGAEHVSATAPSSAGASTVDDYRYRAGAAERIGPSVSQPADIDAALFDVRGFDPDSLPGLIAEARRLGGLQVSEAGVTLQPSEETGLRITINVRDDYHSAFVIFAPDGSVMNLWGGAPGSEAAEHDPASAG